VQDQGGGAGTRRPWATWVAAGACVAIFFGIHASGDAESWEGLRRWGYIPGGEVWAGGWWALVTSAFVHLEIWHVAFNVYWLWILGRILEQQAGHARWLLLCLSAAFVSSTAQLAWSDDTGLGFSGVAYAFLGFMWAGRRRWVAFATVVNRDTIGLFVAWLFLCVVLSFTGAWNVGNAAHVAGLAYGLAAGAAAVRSGRRPAAAAGVGAMLLVAVGVLLYAPWSATWTSMRAYDLHEREDYAAAEGHYLRALDLGVDPAWAWGNLCRLYQATGEKGKYDNALARLRTIDPGEAREVEGGG